MTYDEIRTERRGTMFLDNLGELWQQDAITEQDATTRAFEAVDDLFVRAIRPLIVTVHTA